MIDVDDLLVRHLADRANEVQPIDQLEAVMAGSPSMAVTARSARRLRGRVLPMAAAVMLVVAGLAVVVSRGAEPPAAGDTPAIDWSAENVRFGMSSFAIEAGGQRFVGDADEREVEGFVAEDAGQLELRWTEHGVEMRLNVYFGRSATEWWVTDIWTYDGSADGEWLYAPGERFRMPLDEAYVGDVDLQVAADPGALNAGATGRLVIEDVTLLPFTTVDIPVPAPLFNGEPPALPEGIPATGVAWTTRGSYVLELALRIGQQECMSRQGFEFDLMEEQLELGVGVWQPDDVLSVRTEHAARTRGYRTFGGPADSPGPAEVATQGMSQAEIDGYMAALMDDGAAVNPSADGTFRWSGCLGEADIALGGLVTAQETLRPYVAESGIDQEAVIESARADRRTRDALALWSACVESAVGEQAKTPDELARRYAFGAGEPTQREIDVAVADVRCQRSADLQDTYLEAYAEYQRASLAEPARFDELARLRVDLIARAEQVLAARGLTVPVFD